LIRAIKRRCPRAAVVVRRDFRRPPCRLLDRIEARSDELGDIHYVLGMAKSSRLLALAAPLCTEAAAQYAATQRFVQRFA
jgi:hypothetical protein